MRTWCLTTAGQRTHGTTKKCPLAQFENLSKVALQPLPNAPYDLAVWKKAKLHDDCYVVFDNAYYSGPFRLAGEHLLVRGGSREVRLYTSDYQLVATHERAQEPGQRQTHPHHLPPEKVAGVFLTRETCQAAAADIGPATDEVVHTLLADATLERLPMVRRLLAWRERVGDDRLEAACRRALRFGDPSYKTVKGILQQGLESAPDPEPVTEAPAAKAFVRNAVEVFGEKLGGLSWN